METEGQKIIIAHVIHNICLAGTELNVIKQVNALDRNFFKPVIISLSDRQGTAEELIASEYGSGMVLARPSVRNAGMCIPSMITVNRGDGVIWIPAR